MARENVFPEKHHAQACRKDPTDLIISMPREADTVGITVSMKSIIIQIHLEWIST
jgi:hypothetical protein